MGSPGPERHRRPAFWLAGALLATVVVLGGLALLVPAPRSLADEVRYAVAAGSLADGDGLGVRGEAYEFGPTYPAVLAAILAVVPDRDTAYPIFKLANALLFALALIPIYLTARRLLPWSWSLGVAVASLAIPTSVSVSLVMTESAAYPAASLAILVIVLALEKPTVARQVAVLATIGLAFSIRAQFAVLFPAYVAALGVLWAVAPVSRPRALRDLGRFWPTLGVLAAGVVLVVGWPLVSGNAPVGLPGAYDELWAGYDLVEVAKLVVYHLAGLEIYLAVIPLAVAPIVVTALVRSARAGALAEGAFVSAFVAVTACLILVAAAFASTPAGFGHLHDRYLFYVVPLWLVVLALWLHDGLPRPLVATLLGVALAFALPAVTPFDLIGGEGQEAGAAVTYLWSFVNSVVFATLPDTITARSVLGLFVIALVAVALFAPPRLRLAVAGTVAGLIVAATVVAWRESVRMSEDFDAALPNERTWVDETLASGDAVTSLYVSADCGWAAWTGNAMLMTEFFNGAVARAAHLDAPDGSLLPSAEVHLSPDGEIVGSSREPFVADTVLAARGVELAGTRLASGTALPLVLWKVDGPVRLARSQTLAQVQDAVCAAERTPTQSR